MPKSDIAKLVSECLNRCRATGYTLATVARFVDELLVTGQPAEDACQVESIMRHFLNDIHGADESVKGESVAGNEKPLVIDDRD